MPLHIRLARPALPPGVRLPARDGLVPDRGTPHNRRRQPEQLPEPVYRRLARSGGARRPAGRHGHRQHHAAGESLGRRKRHLGHAPHNSQQHRAEAFRAERQADMGQGLREVSRNHKKLIKTNSFNDK